MSILIIGNVLIDFQITGHLNLLQELNEQGQLNVLPNESIESNALYVDILTLNQ
jgi:hypothetical protein